MKRPQTPLIELACKIGLAFLEKYDFDYDKTRDFIHSLLITDIKDGDSVVIETARPGLLIGRKAENIDLLERKLDKKIVVIESFAWADFITPISPMEEDALEQEREAYAIFSNAISEEAIERNKN